MTSPSSPAGFPPQGWPANNRNRLSASAQPFWPGYQQPAPFPGPQPRARNMGGAAQPVPRRFPLYGANPLDAFVRFFTKYAVFSGRASRSEYWWMQFWYFIAEWFVIPLCSAIGMYLGFMPFMGSMVEQTPQSMEASLRGCLTVVIGIAILGGLVDLALLIPSLSLRVRRLHDANASGWWSAIWMTSVALNEILGYAILVSLLVVGFAIADHFPQVMQWLDSDSENLQVLAGIVPIVPTTLFTGLACALLVLLALRVIELVFDLVIGFLASNPAGARFDTPEPQPRMANGSARDTATSRPLQDRGTQRQPTGASPSRSTTK